MPSGAIELPGRPGTVLPGTASTSPWAQVRGQGVRDVVADLVRQRQAELGRPLQVLDLGGGTGGLAVPLAELGHAVTVVDPSPNALATLERRAADMGVADRITARQGDADSLDVGLNQAHTTADRATDDRATGDAATDDRATGDAATDDRATGDAATDDRATGDAATDDRATDDRFDLVCCHGVLEVVDDPTTALAGIARVLTPEGYLSLVVAGRLAVVLAKALAGDLDQARAALTSPDGRWGRTDPLPRRFDLDQLVHLLDGAGYTTLQVHGVRVFADLVPAAALDSASDRQALAALEQAVADHPHYAEALGNLGSGLHAVAQRG